MLHRVRTFAAAAVLLAVLAGTGCISMEPAGHLIEVGTRYDDHQSPPGGPASEQSTGSPATGGRLVVLLIDADVHPASLTVSSANASASRDERADPRGDGARPPPEPKEALPGDTLLIPVDADRASYSIPLDSEGRVSFLLDRGRPTRLSLEVAGEVVLSGENCRYVSSSATYVSLVTGPLDASVPFGISCGEGVV